jgi:hypothetical protein
VIGPLRIKPDNIAGVVRRVLRYQGHPHSHAFPDGQSVTVDHDLETITRDHIPDLKSKLLKRVSHSPLVMERRIISAVHGTPGQGALVL